MRGVRYGVCIEGRWAADRTRSLGGVLGRIQWSQGERDRSLELGVEVAVDGWPEPGRADVASCAASAETALT